MEKRPWIKDLLVAFAGTTLSIILTFGTSALIEHVNRNKDRRLTALMVLSSIESSVRELEESDEIMARKDTVAHWLLDLTLSDVRTLPEEVLMGPISEVMVNYSISTDKTIENIFSSNTDTWKNVGNFQFIDNVGKTYAALRVIENDWKEQTLEISKKYITIAEHPGDFPGKTLPEKILSDGEVRAQLAAISQRRTWLKYITFALRENNRKNMALIGIPEEEVMAFTDERSFDGDDDAANEAFFRGEFAIPAISPDSLTTMLPYTHLLDSLRKTL